MLKKLNRIPPVVTIRACWLWLCGRVRFPRDRLGELIDGENGFTIFRQMTLEPKTAQPKRAGAVLSVRFQFKRFSPKTNRRLSIIPIPFIVAQPGFRSKTWAFQEETGEFQGLYEWDTPQGAEAYMLSFPMKLMKKRSAQKSLTYNITKTGSSISIKA
jgi:hypothetical protein